MYSCSSFKFYSYCSVYLYVIADLKKTFRTYKIVALQYSCLFHWLPMCPYCRLPYCYRWVVIYSKLLHSLNTSIRPRGHLKGNLEVHFVFVKGQVIFIHKSSLLKTFRYLASKFIIIIRRISIGAALFSNK